MPYVDADPGRAGGRWFPFAIFSIGALISVSWLTADLAAQKPAAAAARKEEQEEPGKASQKPARKPAKEEEEDTAKPKRKTPPRVEDEETDSKRPAAADRGDSSQATSLEDEAQRARNPVVKELFKSLSKPHDVVTLQRGTTLVVEPIPQYIGPEPGFKGSIEVQGLDRGKTSRLSRREVAGVDPYEHIALTKVDDFLKSPIDREPTSSKKYLSRFEMLQYAEKALAEVVRFHESALTRGLREGEGWKEKKKELLEKLQRVQLDQLRLLTEAKDWDSAFALAKSLADAYPKQKEVLVEVAKLLASHAEQSLQAEDYSATRFRLFLLEKEFPGTREVEAVREKLSKKAEAIWEEAKRLEKQGDTQAAINRAMVAKNIFSLPGLDDYYLTLAKKNPILYVGVHELPEFLSPARAVTDSERQAVELLFESLVKLSYTPARGETFDPGLAGDMPHLVPLGRQFQIVRNAYWSDGKLVTAADVRRTVQLLSDRKWAGHNPQWADLLENGARVEGDGFHISLTLHQGFLDPLSLMDFKVLPEGLRSADDLNFARQPVGSGPYVYKGRAEQYAVFTANPYYGTRFEGQPDKAGLPRIREIRFFQSKSPADDFASGRLQLLLDLPTSRIREVESPQLNVKVYTKQNRRVYFLAINNRQPVLKNQALRQALAHGFDREKILTECFRADNRAVHRVLNSPYPRGSWACNPKVTADPFDAALAKAQIDKVKESGVNLGKLTLKYPAGDAAVSKACLSIQTQLEALDPALKLELIPRSPRELRHDVEETHEYDLAYYFYDYPSEAYWLWPLFDPQAIATGPGGRNFLGYENDETLASLFQRAMAHREFKVVQDLTHRIHEVLYEKMPLIPLWQLDSHFAVHNSVKGMPDFVDPLLIFTDVERWSLDKR
jgi:ABC-type oligopeptide transport system substrate-binding subunit